MFENHGKKPWFINKTFRKCCHQAGIEDFHFHDLRHSAVTNFSRSGLDWITIKKMVGYDSDLMFFRYAHRTDKDLENVFWFDEIDTPEDTPNAVQP